MSFTVAVTIGDPRGIGPEIIAKALISERFASGIPSGCVVRLIGPDLSTLPLPLDVSRLEQALASAPFPLTYESVGRFDASEVSAGRVSGVAVTRAAQLCLAGDAHGIVTGPIHKAALRRAGWRVPGHTELLQELAGAADVGMLMDAEETDLGGSLRVLLATTHIPLRAVATRVTEELLVRQALLLSRALRTDWNIEVPRLALCALNPHASDGGLFGNEEAATLEPAVERLRSAGVVIHGPVPADTVFRRAVQGEFDAVVAPYHDVGMAAFKTASFGRGVNVTLGLPFVRTSPDHGTALDIAGHDRADPASMLEALTLAIQLTGRRANRPVSSPHTPASP